MEVANIPIGSQSIRVSLTVSKIQTIMHTVALFSNIPFQLILKLRKFGQFFVSGKISFQCLGPVNKNSKEVVLNKIIQHAKCNREFCGFNH